MVQFLPQRDNLSIHNDFLESCVFATCHVVCHWKRLEGFLGASLNDSCKLEFGKSIFQFFFFSLGDIWASIFNRYHDVLAQVFLFLYDNTKWGWDWGANELFSFKLAGVILKHGAITNCHNKQNGLRASIWHSIWCSAFISTSCLHPMGGLKHASIYIYIYIYIYIFFLQIIFFPYFIIIRRFWNEFHAKAYYK